MVHFRFAALLAQNLCTNICMQVEYRILVANYITSDGKQIIIYKKHVLLLAFVSNELLTLMPALPSASSAGIF